MRSIGKELVLLEAAVCCWNEPAQCRAPVLCARTQLSSLFSTGHLIRMQSLEVRDGEVREGHGSLQRLRCCSSA